MATTITLELSAKSIQRAIREISKYQYSLDQKCNVFVQRLAELGVDVARQKLAESGAVYTGELASSMEAIHGTVIPHGAQWFIFTGSEEAPFIEFGTGPKGKENPDLNLPDGVSWNYDSGNTIFTAKDGRRGWFFLADDGKWYFTEGQGSRPFLYETRNALEQEVLKIAKEVFGNA
jgi:hypothetical protein